MKRKPKGYWTENDFANARAEATKYTHRTSMRAASSSAYIILRDAGLLQEIFGDPQKSTWGSIQ